MMAVSGGNVCGLATICLVELFVCLATSLPGEQIVSQGVCGSKIDARNAIKERTKRWKMVVEQREGIGSSQCDNISETRAGTPWQH